MGKNFSEDKKAAYTTIPENRNGIKRSKASIIEELETLSFAEEIERDKNRSKVLIERGERAQVNLKSHDLSDEEKPDMKQEVKSAEVYKRALLLIGSSGMKVTNGEKIKNASENNLPTSTYLAHGSRCLIQIPMGSDNALINWLTSGNKDTDGRSKSQDHNKARSEGKYVYNRSAATHDVAVQGGKVKETKGLYIGARDYVANFFGAKTNHYGIDLACDAEFGGEDSRGEVVKKPDGEHGHLYIHYKAATATEPGSIMFGLEGASPSSGKHSKVGATSSITPTGCSKWKTLNKKKNLSGEHEYQETIVPQRYNGLHATLTKENMSAIVEQDIGSFGRNLATAIPQESLDSFKKQIDKEHLTPELQEPKKLPIVVAPTLWKKVTNKITFGLAYKKECTDYKQYKKDKKLREKTLEKYKESTTRSPSPNNPSRTEILITSTPSLSPDSTPNKGRLSEHRGRG